MSTVLAQHDLATVFASQIMPMCEALRVAEVYESLRRAAEELLGCRRLTVLTFQSRSPRARVRFTSHPNLAAVVDQLIPFDDGALCEALRAGAAADAETEQTHRDAGVRDLTWSLDGDLPVIDAVAVRPLVFGGETYGGLLFHDGAGPAGGALSGGLALDLIARAVGATFMKCEVEEERARHVVEKRVRLDAITRMGRVLNSLDLEVLLQRMMEVALGAVNGQVGSIALARTGREASPELETVVEWGLAPSVVEAIHYASGRTVMREVHETRLPILVSDAAKNPRIRIARQDVSIESYLCIPLYTNRRSLGVLNIVNSTTGHTFSDRDMDLLLTICNLASAALENALLHEEAMAQERIETQLDIANGIQKSLLPGEAPSLPGLDLAGWNRPCEAVGGDYFDFVQLGEGKTAVVIGDVSGHGLGPALLMSSARAALRSFVSCNIGPDEIMVHLNRLLTDQVLTPGTFITMIVAAVDVEDRRIEFTNAGHPPPLVFSTASLSIREPLDRGLVLGVDADAEYPPGSTIHLAPGDIVVFYTDGILDAANADDEWYGKDRLVKALVANRDLPARDLIAAIREDVATFCGDSPPADDLTLVVLKAL